jgi:hypothetical protein
MTRSSSLSSFLATVLAAAAAWGVEPSIWTHTSEADFDKGKFQRVVATNLGDLKLSRGIRALLEQDPRVSAVYSLAQAPDGAIFAGTGPLGLVLRVKDGTVTDALKLDDDVSILSLAIDPQGRLLIGTGGKSGRVLRLDNPGEKPAVLFAHKDVQYVWAMRVLADGSIYAATGPSGQLHQIGPDGQAELVLDTPENNLLSLSGDGKDLLYIGSDPHGLVYRFDRKTRQMYVLYDAAESEISALAVSAEGTLYAATAQTLEETETAGEPTATTQTGRPDGGTGGVPLPSSPPDMPEPPEPPDPNPGEPPPIPKSADPQELQEADDPDDSEDPVPPDVGGDEADGEARDDAAADAEEPKGAAVTGDAEQAERAGNAIYRIDPNGFVTEIFRQEAMFLSLIESDGALLVGTGSQGRIYQVRPATEETLMLAKVDNKQVTALLPTSDGGIVLGLANAGGIAAMTSGFAQEGVYLSPVLDATQISQFGQMTLHGTLPAGTKLELATRSGNVAEPDDAAGAGRSGWSDWSASKSATEQMPITSPAARFLQYRLTFRSETGQATPTVDHIEAAYQIPNLAPAIKSLAVAAPAPAESEGNATPAPVQGTGLQTITWEVVDPNQDELRYALYYRQGIRSPWILLKDEISESTHEWDTRLAADGRYDLKVVASDERANPQGTGRTASRISDAVVVDNTAPRIGNLQTNVAIQDVQVSFTAADRTSPLREFAYTLDSAKDWQAVLPSDTICDEMEEQVSITLAGLAAGPHQLTVRATDSRGNQALTSLLVEIPAPVVGRPPATAPGETDRN